MAHIRTYGRYAFSVCKISTNLSCKEKSVSSPRPELTTAEFARTTNNNDEQRCHGPAGLTLSTRSTLPSLPTPSARNTARLHTALFTASPSPLSWCPCVDHSGTSVVRLFAFPCGMRWCDTEKQEAVPWHLRPGIQRDRRATAVCVDAFVALVCRCCCSPACCCACELM